MSICGLIGVGGWFVFGFIFRFVNILLIVSFVMLWWVLVLVLFRCGLSIICFSVSNVGCIIGLFL